MRRTFDDLSKEEKQKYHIHQHWGHNWMIMFSWYIAILLTVALITTMAMFLTRGRGMESVGFTIVGVSYLGYIACLMLHKVKKMKREQMLVFGIPDDENEYFFGFTKKDLKVKHKEVFKMVEKTISNVEVKDD
jgi:hypothetical protein